MTHRTTRRRPRRLTAAAVPATPGLLLAGNDARTHSDAGDEGAGRSAHPPGTVAGGSKARGRRAVTVTIVAVLVVLGAIVLWNEFGASQDQPPLGASPTETASSSGVDKTLPPMLVLDELPPDWGSEVASPGHLIIDDDGCLALRARTSGETIGLLLPPGTTASLRDGEFTLDLGDGDILTLGDPVSGSGRYAEDAIRAFLPPESPCLLYTTYTGPGQPGVW